MSNPPLTLEHGMTTLRTIGCAPTEERVAWLWPRGRTAVAIAPPALVAAAERRELRASERRA